MNDKLILIGVGGGKKGGQSNRFVVPNPHFRLLQSKHLTT